MPKSLLVKTTALVIAFFAVLAIIAAAATYNRAPAAEGADSTFFDQFVIAGGTIVWFALLPLSFLTVFLTVEYSLTIRRKRLLPAEMPLTILKMIRYYSPNQLAARLAGKSDLVSISVANAITSGRGNSDNMRNTFAESLQDQVMRLLRKIEWVNLIGNVSPMIGLFGTVFGMIKIFNTIVTAGGQPQPAHLAAGISVALVTTFWGLLIAIPALAIHGIFRNRIEQLMSEAAVQGENILSEMSSYSGRQRQKMSSKHKVPISDLGTIRTETTIHSLDR